MQNFGIKDFMTTKISWNETNRMPHDTFNWQGIDGSQVLTYFITTVDQDFDFHSEEGFGATYNGLVTPHTVMGSYHMYRDKALNDDLLLCYGYGDGGGGPTREMVENVKIINELPGLPTIQPSRVDDYFKKLHETFETTLEPIPEWVGELYLEYHRGTYTSQGRVKKQNRQLELAMRALELRYATAWVKHQMPYPMETIKKLWQLILRNQFHDILPGSSIHEVYEDNALEYQTAFEQIDQLTKEVAVVELEPGNQQITLQNDLAWPVQTILELSTPESGYFETKEGQRLASVVHDAQYQLIETPLIPALGAQVIRFVPSLETVATEIKAETVTSIEAADYLITWNVAGQLTRIYDKYNQREVLNGGLGNVLTVYEDRPLNWDNWNIDEDYQWKETILAAEKIQLLENSDLRTVVLFNYRFQQSVIQQKMIITKNNRRIDFETSANWQEHQQLLRTAFTVDILADTATYDIQYGNVRRPTHRNTSWDEARFESVGHKWADLSQVDYGVALLNDSKYGYAVHGQTLSLSLIKSGISPDATADQGNHQFTYSLLPHTGNFVTGAVEQVASELNRPLQICEGAMKQFNALFDFIDAQQPVAVDAVKMSENQKAVILRFHDYSGSTSNLTVRANFECQAVYLTNLAETAETLLQIQENSVEVAVKPYQIVTLAFQVK